MPEIPPPTKSRYTRVVVFCGTSSSKSVSCAAAVVDLGQELIARGIDLVYGGRGIGVDGPGFTNCVGRASSCYRGHAQEPFRRRGDTVGEVMPVSNMHERMAEITRFFDCFIALPGGYGTLEKLLEMISWTQLDIHNKPVGLLNVDGFYDSFMLFIDKAVDDGFIISSQRDIVVSAPTA